MKKYNQQLQVQKAAEVYISTKKQLGHLIFYWDPFAQDFEKFVRL